MRVVGLDKVLQHVLLGKQHMDHMELPAVQQHIQIMALVIQIILLLGMILQVMELHYMYQITDRIA